MKCLAIGDMFIPALHFDAVLKDDPLFDGYRSVSWKEDEPRAEARACVRRIETLGSRAFDPGEEIDAAIADADVVFLHLCPLPAGLIGRARNLKYIVTARGGVENIDMDAARHRGITVVNCPAHNAIAVAEYTVGLMLCEMRNIARSCGTLRQGGWRERYPNSDAIPELNGAAVGIVGFGTIGRLVARRVAAFGSRVLAFDPVVPPGEVRAQGCEPMSMDELLRRSDIVTLHGRTAPGSPALIAKAQLEMMKPTAYLINTARAALIDMEALYGALREGRIMGAAIDVFPREPLPEGYPLLSLDNVTVTNHRGGDTINAYIKAPELLLRQFRELIQTGATRFMVS